MQPDNQPWTPKPYQPDSPAGGSPSSQGIPPQQSPTSADEQEVQIWQHPVESPRPPQQPTFTPSPQPPVPLPQLAPQRLEQSIPLDTSSLPSTPPPALEQWATPQPATPQPPIDPRRYGGRMAELPPLAEETSQTVLPNGNSKKQRLILWLILGLLIVLPSILLILWFTNARSNDAKKQQTTLQKEKVRYNLDALQALGKRPQLVAADIANLEKTDTFYTVFKQAATKPVVHTKWDVFFTAAQDGKRSDKYTLYDTTIDYTTKKFTYDENTFSNLGVFQTRCIGNKQYNYNDSKLTTSPSWQPASDSTNCGFNVATMHLNDGLNAGGLTSKQADTFIGKLRGQGMLSVDNAALVTNKDKQYVALDVTIAPQKQGNGLYAGMQLLMNAFQATGLNPEKHPYTFFGAGGEGAKIQYYIDLSTQLPVYAVMKSTPAFDTSGKPQAGATWSNRFIEYDFPEKITEATLDTHMPVTFTAWPDH